MALESLDTPYRGGFAGTEHRFALTVYFEDTDAYGIVYYANYLKFMERARSDMLRAVGVDQAAELHVSGSAYAVVEVDIKYRRSARLGDDLLVVSTVQQVRASSVDIQQRVMRGAEVLTDAAVTAAFLDGSGRPRRQPKDWVAKFKEIIPQGPMIRILLPIMAIGAATTAGAQPSPAPSAAVIAIPPLTSPDSGAKGNEMLAVGWDATQLIAADLGQTAELMPLKPNRDDYYSYPEVTAPNFAKWRSAGAKILLSGFIQSRSDGRLTVGCYVYDLDKGRELVRKGFVIAPSDWRRAAHKCSGLAFTAATGAPGIFDTRIAYVAESGIGDARTRRIAVMDSDGNNHRYLTGGEAMALTPRLAPNGNRLAYVSFASGRPSIRLLDLGSGQEHPVIPGDVTTFAPRFSPDGSRLVFSMMIGANCDIYVVSAAGGAVQRLTTSPGVDTDPSFSPDGSHIVFESDRGGSQQLYAMNADGMGQRRISFGGGAYATPAWSPDGEWIAFTRRDAGGRRVGIMKPNGTGERLLSNGPADDEPSWAASSRELLFQRSDAAGRSSLQRIPLAGGEPRAVTIPQDGSDPDWSGVMD